MKKKNKKKMSREVLSMIIQTVVSSTLGAWFVGWAGTEGNKTFVILLTDLQKNGIDNQTFWRLLIWALPVFLILNGLINLGIYFIFSDIKTNKNKK